MRSTFPRTGWAKVPTVWQGARISLLKRENPRKGRLRVFNGGYAWVMTIESMYYHGRSDDRAISESYMTQIVLGESYCAPVSRLIVHSGRGSNVAVNKRDYRHVQSSPTFWISKQSIARRYPWTDWRWPSERVSVFGLWRENFIANIAVEFPGHNSILRPNLLSFHVMHYIYIFF